MTVDAREPRRATRAAMVPSVAPSARALLAVAALGAGLLHAALAPSAPPLLLAAFVVVAGAELAWATMTLARETPPLLRAVPVLALVPLLLWSGLAVAGATATSGSVVALPLIPMGTASLLDAVIAATTAVLLRIDRPVNRPSGAMRFVAALLLSACAVSAATIPALGLTDAGVAAVTVHHHH
jgi:hypothetical protein